MITFHVVTIFPKMFDSLMGDSIIKRALSGGMIRVLFYDPRMYTKDKHRKVDERPYGGGPGMVFCAEPILLAVEDIKSKIAKSRGMGSAEVKLFITSPRGKRFSNDMAEEIKNEDSDLVIICGRYEGLDARIKKIIGATEISIGPYTLTGGELPAMVMIDAITRRIDGVLGNSDSIEEKRVASRALYTRPEKLKWKGKTYKVPKVLLSGHHKLQEDWRKKNR